MRRIALVDLLHARAGDPPISLGIASIAASLKRARVPHRVFAHNVATPQSREALTSLADAVADWRPHVAGIGAYVWNDLHLNPLARQLRARNVKVLFGGPQISYHDPKVEGQTLEALYPHADFFIRGRGEQAVVDLAKGVHARGLHVARAAQRRFSAPPRACGCSRRAWPLRTAVCLPGRGAERGARTGAPRFLRRSFSACSSCSVLSLAWFSSACAPRSRHFVSPSADGVCTRSRCGSDSRRTLFSASFFLFALISSAFCFRAASFAAIASSRFFASASAIALHPG